jgi:hypothetical protein
MFRCMGYSQFEGLGSLIVQSTAADGSDRFWGRPPVARRPRSCCP